MNRKKMPLLLMLVAGSATCIITFIQKYTILEKLVSLFVVLLIFYFLGSLLKWTLDYFDEQNAKKNAEEGEVIEKTSEEEGDKKEKEDKENKDNQEKNKSAQ